MTPDYASTRPGVKEPRVLPFSRNALHSYADEDSIFFLGPLGTLLPMTEYPNSIPGTGVEWESIGRLVPEATTYAYGVEILVAKGGASPFQFTNVQLNRLAAAMGITCRVLSRLGITFRLRQAGEPFRMPLRELLDALNALVVQGTPVSSRYSFVKEAPPPVDPPSFTKTQDRLKPSSKGVVKRRTRRTEKLEDSLSQYFKPKNARRTAKR